MHLASCPIYPELQERLKHAEDQSKELQESYDQLQNDYDKYVRKYKRSLCTRMIMTLYHTVCCVQAWKREKEVGEVSVYVGHNVYDVVLFIIIIIIIDNNTPTARDAMSMSILLCM